jgi:hypothetical protein
MTRSRKSLSGKTGMSVFVRSCHEVFASWLEGFGFSQGETKVDRWTASCCFVNGRRYVRAMANADPREPPGYCNIVLGEGELSWPEVDWNGVALWRLARAQRDPGASEYLLGSPSHIRAIVRRMRLDLERYALDFLHGDLSAFTQVRAQTNRAREPYTIHVPMGDGTYRTEVDPTSAALKSRFS